MASAYLNPQDDKREKKNLPFRLIFFRFFFRKKKIFDMILCWKKKTSLGVVNVVFKNTQSDSWTRWFIGYYYLLLIASQSQSLPKYTKRENEYRENVHSLWEFFFFLKSFRIKAQRKMDADNFSDHKFIWKQRKPARVRFPVSLRSSTSQLTTTTEISIFVRLFSLITTTRMKWLRPLNVEWSHEPLIDDSNTIHQITQ